MSQPSERAAGNIYDLGYRRYEGVRLGRHHAVLALYTASLRAAFGLGRRTSAKIIPVALVIIAMIPALIQLGVASTLQNVEIVRLEEYFEYVQVVLALFVAAVAPELLGRDMRNRTLALYFSRPLKRADYALAKIAALTTAMLFLTLLPVSLMFVGNGLASSNSGQYFRDNFTDIFPIIGSSLLLSLFTSSLALALAVMTPRRAYATGAIIAVFVFSSTIASILLSIFGSDSPGRFSYLIGMYWLMRGVTFWVFRAHPQPGDQLAEANIPGEVFFVVMAAVIAVAIWFLVRRYERMSA